MDQNIPWGTENRSRHAEGKTDAQPCSHTVIHLEKNPARRDISCNGGILPFAGCKHYRQLKWKADRTTNFLLGSPMDLGSRHHLRNQFWSMHKLHPDPRTDLLATLSEIFAVHYSTKVFHTVTQASTPAESWSKVPDALAGFVDGNHFSGRSPGKNAAEAPTHSWFLL